MGITDCPPLSTQKKVSVNDLQRLYASTNNFLSHLMADSVNDTHIDITEMHVKIFLNDVEMVYSQVLTSTEKPVWSQKYNLLCLLNSKEDMRQYGPARRRWEGDDSGEKNMQKIKQVFIAFNSNWHLNMHNKYFVEKL